MEDCAVRKVHVLGSDWLISFMSCEQDKQLKINDGYCDHTTRHIVIRKYDRPPKPEQLQDMDVHEKQILRHEIVHAFLFESGLGNDSAKAKAWAANEEMIDWIAFQHEKLHKAFEEAGAV